MASSSVCHSTTGLVLNSMQYNTHEGPMICAGHRLNFSSGSLPTRQVQMFDVAIPLVDELVLSAFYILPPSSSPASFVLVFLLIFFLAFSLRLPFLTVILLLECVRSTSFV